MPGFDRTGPQGAGPMTGGARGTCNPASSANTAGYGRGMAYGRGFRRGYGQGMGARRGFSRGGGFYPPAAPIDEASEMDMLKAEAVSMKNALDAINRRIEALEKGSE